MDITKQTSTPRDTHAEHVHVSMRTYTIVFVALMVLLFITIGAAYLDFGPLNITIALLIAMVKAGLVVLFFMHVKYASRMTQIFVAASFLWLGLLFILTFSDYASRETLPVSAGWTHSPIRQLEIESASEQAAPTTVPGHTE